MSALAEISLSVGRMIAGGCKRHPGVPPFSRVVHDVDAVLIETIDGSFYRISVEPVDAAAFSQRSTSHD